MADQRTPAQAAKTGEQWRWRGYCCLGLSIPFMLFQLDNLFWLMVVAAFACARVAAREYGWRDGYLDCKAQSVGRVRGVRRG